MLAQSALLLALSLAQVNGDPPAFSAADLEHFEKRVRPILVERCYECHSADAKPLQGGLLLDSREAILRGGDNGPAVVAGEAHKGLLVEAIRYQSESLQMPPNGKLPQPEIDTLIDWIQRGLPFPSSSEVRSNRRTIDINQGRQHWAFQPVLLQALPAGQRAESRLDAFVTDKQAQRGLAASPPADRRRLIRRASFDLRGLPPTAEEGEAFAADRAPDAYERLIDRYLASPEYGERWGRVWLDLARYCDVAESWREGEAQPWLYRDWVVQALNDDLSYDRFVQQQLAADLLPGALPKDNAALGFLGLSPTYWKELKLDHKVIKQVVAEEWEERIEAISGTFLGLTVACARCHDHKFDPITTQDYYALAGILASIRQEDRPIIQGDLAAAAAAARSQAKQLHAEIDKLTKLPEQTEEVRRQVEDLRRQITALEQTPHYHTPLAPGIADASIVVVPDGEHRTKIEYRPGQAQDAPVHIRGNAANPGPPVPRRYLAVLASDPAAPFHEGSGRRELAQAMVTQSAPLAARVIVNRVWLQHFGRGLVTTPSNFGVQGDRPSHPELLDDLSARLIEHDWSLKWLHRQMMNATTYRQSGFRDPARYSSDPDNVWLWRMPPKRLSVEAWRDTMLWATGELDRRVGGPASDLASQDNRRRTIYGQVKRRELDDLLRLHDFPDPVVHHAAREGTTTPLQQLFALNSPLVHQRSEALARRLDQESPADPASRVQWLYQLLFGRAADPDEVAAACEFVGGASSADEAWRQYCHALLTSNEFLFVD